MLTFLWIGGGVFLVIGLIVLVMATGAKGTRHGKAAGTVVADQQLKDPRGSVRSGTGPD